MCGVKYQCCVRSMAFYLGFHFVNNWDLRCVVFLLGFTFYKQLRFT
jgi:hypothetical protein